MCKITFKMNENLDNEMLKYTNKKRYCWDGCHPVTTMAFLLIQKIDNVRFYFYPVCQVFDDIIAAHSIWSKNVSFEMKTYQSI